MYCNKVEICGVNTARLPILTNEEKDALFIQIRQGDAEAREQFIKGNLRLVLSVIRRFSSAGENVDDLFQIGCIGLIKAIDHFNTELGVRFSTYAVPMIIGEIRRFLRDNNALRVSRSLRDTAYRAMQSREALEKQLGREPTMDEIAGEVSGCKVVKLNVDEAPNVAARYNVMSIPTLMVFRQGEAVDRSVGVQSKQHILNMLKG